MKKRLVVIILVCVIFVLFAVCSFISDIVKIPLDTYNTRRFFVDCDTWFENIDAYCSGQYKTAIRAPYVINFKDKNVVFECARVGRGVSKNNMAYYVILYKNGTLKYIKGEALVEANPVGDKVFNKREKYYEGSEVDYLDISFFLNYKKRKLKLSQEEADVLIEKLKLAEKYYPYDNKFHKDTGEAFEGYYFNGNYYGDGNHIGSDKIVYDAYNDVCYYIESLIGVESE